MRSPRKSLSVVRIAFLALSLLAMGAECTPLNTQSLPPSGCNPSQVEFSIFDDGIINNCNCGGTSGEKIAYGTSFNCTFALGKTVFIHYIGGISLRHQIVSVGSPAIPDSETFNPQDRNTIRNHAFTPTAAGTYSFRDNYFPTGIFGTLTITP